MSEIFENTILKNIIFSPFFGIVLSLVTYEIGKYFFSKTKSIFCNPLLIGIVLSVLFSIAVVLISKYTANIHLDIDAVLLGEIAFAPFHTTEIFGFKLATGLVSGLAILIVNLLFITIFFKEIKISIFDKALALTLGLLPEIFHYLLMTLVSVTSVVSFDIVGATLMISFMVGPATTAYMISKNLKTMLVYSSYLIYHRLSFSSFSRCFYIR